MIAKALEDAMAANEAALDTMLKGDHKGYVPLLTDRDDLTWGNPFGPFVIGRENVEAALASAATRMPGGRATPFDHIATYVSDTLAVVVQQENGEAPVKGTDDVTPVALRVTSVYRLEDGAWKLVHRHADPITTPR